MHIMYEGTVAGVSFENPDGSSRQAAIQKMIPWMELCQGKLRLGEYEGKPSLAVIWTVCAGSALKASEAQIGFIPATEVQGILELADGALRAAPAGRSKIDLVTVLFVSAGPSRSGTLGVNIRAVVP